MPDQPIITSIELLPEAEGVLTHDEHMESLPVNLFEYQFYDEEPIWLKEEEKLKLANVELPNEKLHQLIDWIEEQRAKCVYLRKLVNRFQAGEGAPEDQSTLAHLAGGSRVDDEFLEELNRTVETNLQTIAKYIGALKEGKATILWLEFCS